MNALANDPLRRALALEGYQEVLTRLQSELDVETLQQVLPDIEVEQAPIVTPEPIIPTLPVNPTETIPLPTLSGLPLDVTVTLVPNVIQTTLPNLPETIPTKLPEIMPTIEIPPLLP